MNGNCDEAFLDAMLKLLMTSTLPNLKPTILLN